MSEYGDFKEGKQWMGILIVAFAFVFGILLYAGLGDLGFGEFGPLVYLVPLLGLVAGGFAYLSRTKRKQ